MFDLAIEAPASKHEHYQQLVQQAQGMLQGERSMIANAANFAALAAITSG